MAYTAFKHDPAETRKRAASIRKRFLARNPGKNPLAYGVEIMSEMLEEDPRRYLTYGPYWWALKDVLLRHGCAFGDTMDFEIAREYRGEDDYQTLVIAESFQEFYYDNYFVGANAWHLDPDAVDDYILRDPDYELAARMRGL